jgi:hypothetical protein
MPTSHINGRQHDSVGQPIVPNSAGALSAGFGTTASVAMDAAATDGAGKAVVTSSGTGQAARPTLTITFVEPFVGPDGVQKAPRSATCSRQDNLATAGQWRVTSLTATQIVLMFDGTPVAAEAYGVFWDIRP